MQGRIAQGAIQVAQECWGGGSEGCPFVVLLFLGGPTTISGPCVPHSAASRITFFGQPLGP